MQWPHTHTRTPPLQRPQHTLYFPALPRLLPTRCMHPPTKYPSTKPKIIERMVIYAPHFLLCARPRHDMALNMRGEERQRCLACYTSPASLPAPTRAYYSEKSQPTILLLRPPGEKNQKPDPMQMPHKMPLESRMGITNR